MGQAYTQLNLEDQCTLARLHAQGCSLREIAASLARAPATIARELKRNRSRQQGYRPGYAQEQARARRWRGVRLDRDAALRAHVLTRLKPGWSLAQITGRLRLKAGKTVRSPETSYRFIYAQTTRTKAGRAWGHFLPRTKERRGQRRRQRSPAARTTCRRHRPPAPGPLGSRPDALPQRRASGAHRP